MEPTCRLGKVPLVRLTKVPVTAAAWFEAKNATTPATWPSRGAAQHPYLVQLPSRAWTAASSSRRLRLAAASFSGVSVSGTPAVQMPRQHSRSFLLMWVDRFRRCASLSRLGG
jgi:hypothetical protein